LQVESITRRFTAAIAALALLATWPGPAQSAQTDPGWRDAPGYVAMFAPAAHREAYRAAVSPLGLDAVLEALAADPALLRSPGAWTARAHLPADAFGRSRPYDRWTLARLYGSRQPRVARGARTDGGRVIESWTLVSPYPTADLARLDEGTLLIVLGIAQ
jgi:hypothetical protein